MAKLYNKSGGLLTVRLLDGSSASLRPRTYTEIPDDKARSGDVLAKERKGLLKAIFTVPSKPVVPAPVVEEPAPEIEEKEPSVIKSEEEPGSPDSADESPSDKSEKLLEEKTPPEEKITEDSSSTSSRRGRRRKKRS